MNTHKNTVWIGFLLGSLLLIALISVHSQIRLLANVQETASALTTSEVQAVFFSSYGLLPSEQQVEEILARQDVTVEGLRQEFIASIQSMPVEYKRIVQRAAMDVFGRESTEEERRSAENLQTYDDVLTFFADLLSGQGTEGQQEVVSAVQQEVFGRHSAPPNEEQGTPDGGVLTARALRAELKGVVENSPTLHADIIKELYEYIFHAPIVGEELQRWESKGLFSRKDILREMREERYYDLLTHPRISPALESANPARDSIERFTGADGQEVVVVVRKPDIQNGETVHDLRTTPIPQNPTETYAFIKNAVETAKSRQKTDGKASRILFPKGTYRISNPACVGKTDLHQKPFVPHILIDQVRDMELNFYGSFIEFQDICPGIEIRNSQRVFLRNVGLDWSERFAAKAIVREDTEGSRYLEIPAEYEIWKKPLLQRVEYVGEFDFSPNLPRPRWPAVSNDEIQYHQPENGFAYRPKTVQGNIVDRFYPIVDSSRNYLGSFPLGTELLAQHYDRTFMNTVSVRGATTEDVTLDRISVYGGTIGFLAGGIKRGVAITNSRVIENPSDPLRLISTNAGGSHIAALEGDSIVAGNNFRGQSDDSGNVHGYYYTLKKIEGNRLTIGTRDGKSMPTNVRFMVGDTIPVINERMAFLRDVRATSDSTYDEANGTIVVEVDTDLPVTLEGMNVLPLNLIARRFIFRDNFFRQHRGRGLLIQAPNGYVVRNDIRATTRAGVHFGSDMLYFDNGPGAHNVVFENNSIINTNGYAKSIDEKSRYMGAVSVSGELSDSEDFFSSFPNNQYLRIVNNLIDATPGIALFMSSAKHVLIEGNTIRKANLKPFEQYNTGLETGFPAKGSMYVIRSSDVTIRNNWREGDTTKNLVIDATTNMVDWQRDY